MKRIEGLILVEEVKKESSLNKVHDDRTGSIRALEVEAILRERIERKTCRATRPLYSNFLRQVISFTGRELNGVVLTYLMCTRLGLSTSGHFFKDKVFS